MSESNGTKNALARSMKNLMGAKSFSKISITDICDGCGMNRKSFYYHFKDKYDLMNWIFYSDFIGMIGTRQCEGGWELLEAVCELFYNEQGFYRSAFKTAGQNSFREYLLESMHPLVDFLFENIWSDVEARDIIGKLFCEGYILAVKYWLDGGCKTPPKQFVDSIRKFINRLAEENI